MVMMIVCVCVLGVNKPLANPNDQSSVVITRVTLIFILIILVIIKLIITRNRNIMVLISVTNIIIDTMTKITINSPPSSLSSVSFIIAD